MRRWGRWLVQAFAASCVLMGAQPGASALDVHALQDNFTGSWKSCLWDGYQRYGGATYEEGQASYNASLNTVRNDRLDLKVPSKYLAGMSWETGLKSTYELRGNFDVQVDFFLPMSEYWTNLDVRGVNVMFVELMAGDAGARRRQVRNSQFNPNTRQAVYNPHLWVANHNDNRVTQIDTDRAVILGQYSVGSSPSRTTVDLNGDVWINHRCDSTVWRIRASQCSPPTCTVAEVNASYKDRFTPPYSNGQCNGGGAAVDKNNNPWIGFLNARTVIRMDRSTGQVMNSTTTPGTVYGLAVDNNDFVWSDEHWDGYISKIDGLTGARVASYRPNDGLCFAPYGISVDSFGKIWMSQWGSCPYLTRFDPVSNTWSRFFKPAGNGSPDGQVLDHNRGIAADNQGLVWTVSSTRNVVSVWNMSSGQFIASYATCGTPTGVALDRNNLIWVTCADGNVYRHDRNGQILNQIPMGYSSYSYSDMTGYQLRNFGSDAWKENFLENRRESSDTYYLSSIENNYGGGIENGVGTNVATDPSQAPVDNLTTISTLSYQIRQMFFSDYYHTDKLTRVIAHPPELEGLWGLRTPFEDRNRNETNLVSMRAKQDLDVYVAFDARAARLPGWLDVANGYAEVAGKKVTTTDAASPEFKLYKKTFTAGSTITLGGAQTTAVAAANYGSCAEIKRTFPTAPDGNYSIRTAGANRLVFCDMSSDMGAGHTMIKVNLPANQSNSGNQDDYRAACAAIGMEVVVPRSRSHADALIRYNGGTPPNLINVFPKSNGVAGLENWTGRCRGQACDFYVSPDRSANCGGGHLEPNGDNNVNNSIYRITGAGDLGCGFGRWNDANNVVATDLGTVICSTNDAQLPQHRSCADIVTAGSVQNVSADGISGPYTLLDRANAPYQAWCDMTTAGGGWTLGMKLDRASTRFNYDSSDWTVNSTFNPASVNLTTTDAKFASFASVPLDEILVGMNTSLGSNTAASLSSFTMLRVPVVGSSLMALFQGGFVATSVGRNAWKGLIAGSSLQSNCNSEGINVYSGGARVRVGMINNQENDCNSPDSRIGLGGRGNACGQNDNIASGNTARCSPDNGEKDLPANGVLFARKQPAQLVGHWPMDNSYNDASGRGHHFSASSMNAFGAGVTQYGTNDRAASFNGATSFLQTAHSAALSPNSMTIAFWLNLTSNVDVDGNNNWRALLYKGATAGAPTGYNLVLEEWGGQTIAFDTGHAGGTHRWWPNRFAVATGKWAHVVFTYDDATRTKQAWLDGQLIDSIQVPSNLGARAHNSDPLRVSNASTANPNGAGAIPGRMDDLRIYSGVLSESFIQTLAGKTAGSNLGNYFVYFVPTAFTTPPPSPGAYTLINDPAHKQLQAGGSLRIVRSGSNWTFWYRDLGSGTSYNAARPWVNMGTLNLGTQDTGLKLRTRLDPFWHNGPTNEPGGAVSVQFDNFKVNSADGVVGGPSETCNGIDDDCDNQVDETFPGQGSMCNTGLPGACGQGVLTCTNGGVVCRQINQPGPEVCDGIDNDCNGTVDDYVSGGQAAGGAGTVVSGQSCTDNTTFGPCRAGQYVCQGGSMVCKSAVPPRPDVCDGVDNDCDGTVDNDRDNIFYNLEGHHLLGYQRSSPYIWPRPVVGTKPLFTDNGDRNDDFVSFDGSSSLAAVHELRKARVILYLDPTLANASNPRGRYVLWLTHGKKDAAQGAATATYGIRYKDGQPFNVLFNDQNETQQIAGGGDKYQTLVVSSAAGETGGVAVGPFDSQKIWDMEISVSYQGDIEGWELYNAEMNRGYDLNQEEKLVLRNNYMNDLKAGNVIVTADTGTPCAVPNARGVCARGTGACVMGRVQCTQTVNPQPEVCDGLDNSCDGTVDEADPNLVVPVIEARQTENPAIRDWTRLFTIDNGISVQEQINFVARGGDDRVGSVDMRDVADPTRSIQDTNKSLVTFHRDLRPGHGTISMPLIQGKRVQGLDGAVSAATSVEIELETLPSEVMTSFFDDRIAQSGAAADQGPFDYSTTRKAFRWTLSRWNEGLNFIREADAAVLSDLFVDKFPGQAPNPFTLRFRRTGSMTSWTVYQPYRNPIELLMNKDAEFRARALSAQDATCVIQDHALAECLGAESRYFCVAGELRCHNNPTGCCLDKDGDGHLGYDPVKCDIGTDCDDNSAAVNPGAAEVCDGKDNNCAGCTSIVNGVCQATCDFNDAGCITVDETFPEAGRECEDAARMITNTGVCRAESLCINGRVSCEQIVPPSAELCDGLDNDCDGQVDGTQPPMSTKILGPEECKFERSCVCRGGTGIDNCDCVEGLSPEAYVSCPEGSFFNGAHCQPTQCVRDADCAQGEICQDGACAPNPKQNPLPLNSQAGGTSPQAGCAQSGASPASLAPLALSLLGFACVGRLRRRKVA